jgi:hypothetical protein
MNGNHDRTTEKTQKTPANIGKRQECPGHGKHHKELENAGRLGVIDSARVQIALHLARMVDEFPENPTLWREYRTAEKALREENENYGDPFDELIRSLSAEVGNQTKPKTKNPRP